MDKAKILAMLKLGKDATVTAQNLTDAFPEQIREVVAAAHAAGVESVDTAAATQTAVIGATERITALALAFFGQANGEKFKTLISTSVTPEQITALGIAPAAAAVETEAEKKLKADLLAGLQAAGAGNPGAGSGTAAGGDKDFMALVAAYQQENKCSRTDAIKATANAHPEVHDAYIEQLRAKKQKK